MPALSAPERELVPVLQAPERDDMARLIRTEKEVEGRFEELDELGVGAHQTPFDRGQGLPRPLRVGGTGDHRPGLREGVDLALIVLRRA